MARRRSRSRAGSKADQEFVSEAEEILERVRLDLADLRDQQARGTEVAPDLVNRLFRSAHSLKGLAGLFGFQPIHDLAHHLEDVLDALRLGKLVLHASAVDLVDRSVQLFSALLEAVGDDAALAAAAEPVPELIRGIEGVKQPPEAPSEAFAGLDVNPSLMRALTEYEEHRLRENLRRGRHILLADATFEIISFEDGLSELSAALREVGEVISTLPAPGESSDAQIRFSLLVGSDLPGDEVASRLDFPDTSIRSIRSGTEAPAPEPGSGPPVAEEPPPLADLRDLESLKSISETVRVDIRKLDELMNLVGELVIQRGMLSELIARLSGDAQTVRIGNELSKLHKVLDRKLRELQAAVLDVRMVPLRQVFEKISRVVRRLRHELDRDARLELRGADTELDKLIVEELVDPLMHIVRNALDHAIEPPDERRAAGKEPQGSIRIEAFQRGNHVVISVSDDGRGIDLEALRERARSQGLVPPDEVPSDRETLDLIFAPGLTTRSEVTETSGRGVGLDVVRHNLTLLGGAVDVESTPGRGTTFLLTLPITLAIVQSLVVAVGAQRFAIPLTAVHETLLVEPTDIQRSEGRELLNLRGEALLLRRLAREFGLPEADPDGRRFAVVMGLGDARVGLLVDRLDGQQDTVIKPIQGPIAAVRGVAGATELGGQEPVLVLDVSAFLAEALGRREAA